LGDGRYTKAADVGGSELIWLEKLKMAYQKMILALLLCLLIWLVIVLELVLHEALIF
jgi:hypothetical protein